MQPHPNTKKVFAHFLPHASFPQWCNYAKISSTNTSALSVSHIPAVLLYHAYISEKQ